VRNECDAEADEGNLVAETLASGGR
jgi:hypothetical protein